MSDTLITPSAASVDLFRAVPNKQTINIPLHLQDKEGFCGAACMMMLLEDAFPECLKKISQSALMRRVKQLRDARKAKDVEVAKQNKKSKPEVSYAEELYAWHASPRELAAVMNDCYANADIASHTCKCRSEPIENLDTVLKMRPWEAIGCPAWKATMKDGKLEPTPSEPKSPCAFNKIIDSLGDVHGDKRKGPGCIALIWHRSLGTRHPHWVVIESYDSKKNSFRVLDPSPAGRPDRPLRYDSFPHYAVKKGNLPYHCDCLVWRDSNNEQQAASKHWIHEDRLEELMDEAAARCGGLRYLVVRNTNVTEDESKSAYDNAKDPLLDEDKPEPTLAESLRKAEFGEKLQDIYDKLSPLLKQ